MTMPQMPRPETATAPVLALKGALLAAERGREECQGKLTASREDAEKWEAEVRKRDHDIRDLRAALDRLGAS